MSGLSAATAVDPYAHFKRAAGEYAVRFVESGMVVGLGTGSTAIHAVRHLAARLQSGDLRDVVGFATSTATRLATSA